MNDCRIETFNDHSEPIFMGKAAEMQWRKTTGAIAHSGMPASCDVDGRFTRARLRVRFFDRGEPEVPCGWARWGQGEPEMLQQTGTHTEIKDEDSLWRQEPRYLELEFAIQDGQIEAYYQPIVDAGTHQIVAMEALARWNHPLRGLVPPVEFIPFAESCDLIGHIGEAILRQACVQGNRWHDAGYPIDMYVNVSPRQFEDASFPKQVQKILMDTGFDPRHLHFELTEGLPSSLTESLQRSLCALGDMGIHLVLDDFGTEYATLQCMLEFPFSAVKLDQVFVRNVHEDKRRAEMVKAVLRMARRLGLTLVAEGVETAEEAEFLRKHKCTKLQGYLFGKPVTSEQAESALALRPASDPSSTTESVINHIPPTNRVTLLENKVRDYEWLERCVTPMLDADDVLSVMATVRGLFEERFPLDRFGILVGTMNDRYCIIHEIVTRDDMEACPTGSLMIVRGTGLERVYRTGQAHYNPDISARPEFAEDGELASTGLRSMARIPLIAKGNVFGVMTVKCAAIDAYSPSDLQLMTMVAGRLAANIYTLKLIYSLQEAAYKDTLTGAFNRRFLTEAIDDWQAPIVEKLTGVELEQRTPVSVLFVDIDHFKRFNDSFGHTAGDEQLKSVSARLHDLAGDDGFVVRFGGDEFIVVMPDVPQGSAQRLADELLQQSDSLFDETNSDCALSVGVAEGAWDELERLVLLSDTHMYKQKAREPLA